MNIVVKNEDEKPDLDGDAPGEYAENGTDPVVTFTATDPENGADIEWKLVTTPVDSTDAQGDTVTGGTVSAADIEDRGDFTFTDGVLSFKSSPNFEVSADDDTNNEYKVTVQATGAGTGAVAYQKVVIKVTNEEEDGDSDPVHVAAAGQGARGSQPYRPR